jgi:hypothetical protein
MPPWRQYFHRMASGLLCLLLATVAFVGARPLLAITDGPGRNKTLLLISILFVLISVVSLGVQFWFQRRIISEFQFDGRTLQYRTLGLAGTQERQISDVAAVRDWRGRISHLGYRITFFDGKKAYLELTVPRAAALAERLRLYIDRD